MLTRTDYVLWRILYMDIIFGLNRDIVRIIADRLRDGAAGEDHRLSLYSKGVGPKSKNLLLL